MFEHDPILEAIDAELERQQRNEKPRQYLGASAIGDECERKLFYSFRQASPVVIEATGLKAIADGHATEALMIQRLRLVEDVELWVEEDGKQIGFTDLGGHFQGNVDGVIKHPSIGTAIWECKATNVKKFDKLKKLRAEDPYTALSKWDATYFGQAQIYMHYLKIDRHYLTGCTPGGRDVTSVVTVYQPEVAEHLIERAKRVIFGNTPAPRVSGDSSWYACKWCQHWAVCHASALPRVNCRTCAHSTPMPEGGWRCEKFDTPLSYEAQLEGCVQHRYHPRLMSGVPVEAGDDETIVYNMNDGSIYRDGDKR